MKTLLCLALSSLLCFVTWAGYSADYRTVKIIINNATKDPLVIQGYDVLRGNWLHGEWATMPQAGESISADSQFVFGSGSQTPGVGTSGFLNLQVLSANIQVSWDQPWDGEPILDIRSSNPHVIMHSVQSGTLDADTMAHFITLMPASLEGTPFKK